MRSRYGVSYTDRNSNMKIGEHNTGKRRNHSVSLKLQQWLLVVQNDRERDKPWVRDPLLIMSTAGCIYRCIASSLIPCIQRSHVDEFQQNEFQFFICHRIFSASHLSGKTVHNVKDLPRLPQLKYEGMLSSLLQRQHLSSHVWSCPTWWCQHQHYQPPRLQRHSGIRPNEDSSRLKIR